jgi:PDZ domain
MNRTNATKLLLSSGLVALVALFIWMVTSGFDMTTVYGATRPIPYTYDKGPFNITDVSIQDGGYLTNLIGFIENTDPFLNTIKGVSLKIEMYDRNNHLIDVAESGYSSLPNEFPPLAKSAFKIPIEKNNDLDHIKIQILANDWGTSGTYGTALGNQSSNRPYIGIIGLALTPDISKQIGLNQTKGFLLTTITKDSPANKSGLRGGSNTTTFNGRDIDVGGDIILKIDNKQVSDIYDIMRYVQSQKHAGDKIHLTILRDNAIKEVDLTLGTTPSQPISQTGGNQTQEELYIECVNVAGKSLCDSLFKR